LKSKSAKSSVNSPYIEEDTTKHGNKKIRIDGNEEEKKDEKKERTGSIE
jgi:hypothetical protein